MSDSGSVGSTPRCSRSRSHDRKEESQNVSFHGLDPYKLRFKPPAKFIYENLTGQSKPQFLKEQLVNDGDDDTELWLIRVPVGVNVKMLNDVEVPLAGVQQLGKLSEKGQEVYESHAFQDSLIQNARINVLLPSQEEKALVAGPEFKGQLNITQTMKLPVLNTEMAGQSDDNIFTIPEGLKIRYKPFAAETTGVHSSDSVRPASKKRKHKERFTKIVQKAIDVIDKSLEASPKRKKKKRHHSNNSDRAEVDSDKKHTAIVDTVETIDSKKVDMLSGCATEKSKDFLKHKKRKKHTHKNELTSEISEPAPANCTEESTGGSKHRKKKKKHKHKNK